MLGPIIQRIVAGRVTLLRTCRGLENALWLSAAACLGVLLTVAIVAAGAMRGADRIIATPVHKPGTNTPAIQLRQPPSTGRVIGQIAIPALRLSVPMTSGIETTSLLAGVGRLEGSAVPGGLGTIVLAGHRDTYLRPLERVATGMEILLTDQTGTYHYSVDRSEIVSPEEVDAIAVHARPELALVTCYPFHFIGPAPKRFVVHAHLVSLIPDQG